MEFIKIMLILNVFIIIKLIIITPKAKNILRDGKVRVLLKNKPYYLKNKKLDLKKSIYNKKNYQIHNLNRSLTTNHKSNILLEEFKEELRLNKNKKLDLESMDDIKYIGKGGINYIYSYKNELVIRKPIDDDDNDFIINSNNLQIELQQQIKNNNMVTNIAEIIDFDTDYTLTFMDFYKSDLNNFFNTKVQSRQELIAIFEKCKSILEDIHSLNFVHRDVKPENFLLLKNDYINDLNNLKNDIYIADFDLMKKYDDNITYKLDGFTAAFINFKLIQYNHKTDNISINEIMEETVSFQMLKNLDISALALMILYKAYNIDYHSIKTLNEWIEIQNRLFMKLNNDLNILTHKENIFIRIWIYIKNWFRNSFIVKFEKNSKATDLYLLRILNDILNN